jgi:hypothetical protein
MLWFYRALSRERCTSAGPGGLRENGWSRSAAGCRIQSRQRFARTNSVNDWLEKHPYVIFSLAVAAVGLALLFLPE